jgi:hypothetical protein
MIQAFNQFPAYHDREAYTDATPTAPGDISLITGYSDACWDGQFGNMVPEDIPLPLFK